MTAHFVLLAQTKVGFLSGGRGRHMKELSENEVLAQLEEAYARATVALTRAQKLCIIMGPLDMRGLPGAATVIGCLKYGAGVCGVHDSNQAAEVFLKDGSLNDGPDDDAFLQSLRRSLKTARGAYPPVALAEIYQEFKSPLTMIRRWVGGWGPRYLVFKRERGPVRVPSSLTEDRGGPLMSSFWNHERTWLRLTP